MAVRSTVEPISCVADWGMSIELPLGKGSHGPSASGGGGREEDDRQTTGDGSERETHEVSLVEGLSGCLVWRVERPRRVDVAALEEEVEAARWNASLAALKNIEAI